jgi:nucleoside-diphosphate-sugar epimerase
MTKRKIVAVAGGSGALGGLIVQELIRLGADVIILTRKRGVDEEGRCASTLPSCGSGETSAVAVRRESDYDSVDDLSNCLRGVDVVVSALAGLDDVIVGVQGRLILAASNAGVKKFVPSDFSIDFHRLPAGDGNRNLDTRREFHDRFEGVPIRKTSILNGAFANMLTGTAPFVLFGQRRVLCWGDATQRMDWTTIEDVARYTAHAALDDDSPRFLRIAGDQISASDLSNIMSEITGVEHHVLRPGGLRAFRCVIRLTRFIVPGRGELYPPWQGMQYMHDMYSGLAKFERVDNERYPVVFRSVKDLLAEHLRNTKELTRNESRGAKMVYHVPLAGILAAISVYYIMYRER